MGAGPRRERYHHGDLRAALVQEGLAQLAARGPADFSVAAVAKRVGVSTAAPYRHFADRDHLLAAVVTRGADDLADAMTAAEDRTGAGPGPVDRLAAIAGAYAAHVSRHRVGLDLIFSPPLRALDDHDLAAAGRRLMDLLLAPAAELVGPDAALPLLEQVVALAHGYATLDADFLDHDRVSDRPLDVRARRAVARLVASDAAPGAGQRSASPGTSA